VSAPATREEWAAAAKTLAEFRNGRDPEAFPHVFGIDPGPLREWCAADAMDSMTTVVPAQIAQGMPVGAAVAAMLATHTQIGIELGLHLVMTGRVQP
jgi:hypothetical protein